jgi:hypothetical protein
MSLRRVPGPGTDELRSSWNTLRFLSGLRCHLPVWWPESRAGRSLRVERAQPRGLILTESPAACGRSFPMLSWRANGEHPAQPAAPPAVVTSSAVSLAGLRPSLNLSVNGASVSRHRCLRRYSPGVAVWPLGAFWMAGLPPRKALPAARLAALHAARSRAARPRSARSRGCLQWGSRARPQKKGGGPYRRYGTAAAGGPGPGPGVAWRDGAGTWPADAACAACQAREPAGPAGVPRCADRRAVGR